MNVSEKFRFYLEQTGDEALLWKIDVNDHSAWRSKHTKVKELSPKEFLAIAAHMKELNKEDETEL